MIVSAHGGLASEPIRLASGQGAQAPKQPQACIGPEGFVHVVFGVADQVYYCRSTDGGESYSEPKLAFRAANMALGMRRGPRVVCSERSIVVSVIGGAKGKGQDGDVLAWHSEDNGASWKGPIRVNDVVDSAREGLHAMAVADGVTWCAWLDLRSKQTELYAARSTDDGASWSKNMLVYHSPEGSICQCCHPSIAADKKRIHVLFRNSLGGNRDMYLSSSVDGQAFSKASRLGVAHWPLSACPMDGGMLAIDSAGKLSTVWRRAGELFFTSPGHVGELMLGQGEQPWIASSSQGPVAVWTAGRVGELRLKHLNQPEAATIALDSVARDPMIASQTGLQYLVVCWESIEDSRSSVMAMKIVAP